MVYPVFQNELMTTFHVLSAQNKNIESKSFIKRKIHSSVFV